MSAKELSAQSRLQIDMFLQNLIANHHPLQDVMINANKTYEDIVEKNIDASVCENLVTLSPVSFVTAAVTSL